jgi:hypothetical protein
MPEGKGIKKFRMKQRVRKFDKNEIRINEIGQVDGQLRKYFCYCFRD